MNSEPAGRRRSRSGQRQRRSLLAAANVRHLRAERGVDVSARTVLTWVQTFGPLLAEVARGTARRAGTRWCCDETYVRVKGRWAYLYRAVDEDGQVIDALLREHRDLDSARARHAVVTFPSLAGELRLAS